MSDEIKIIDLRWP